MITTILTAGACLGILALTGMGIALARAAALADARAPHLRPPDGIAAINRQQMEHWRDVGALTPAGYARLRRLMDASANAYPYWSGGETFGTSCVWAFQHRYVLAEWNAESDALALDGRAVEHGRQSEPGTGATA